MVITGASSGIERTTALRFAKNGDTVVVAARRKNLLQSLAEQCEELGAEAAAVQADVTDEMNVEKLAKTTVKDLGRIDVWVNDAGVGAVGKFDELRPQEHRRVIETNLVRSGFRLRPAPPTETQEQVAEVIFQLADEPRDEAHPGGMGKWIGKQHKFARTLTEKQMSVLTERKHFDRSHREPRQSGTLWKPNRHEGGKIHGGWKSGSKWKKSLAIATVAPALAGVVVTIRNRRSPEL